jgi:Cu+-exporting ATPase
MSKKEVKEKGKLLCFHCGDICDDDTIALNDKIFCCLGCKVVFEILEQNNLCKYYSIEKNPGITPPDFRSNKYDFLEDELIKNQFIDFTNSNISTVTFYIPQIHCSSCIWLLENLNRLNQGIIFSEVNFLEKKLHLKYSEEKTSLSKVVELLESIGYEPDINLNSTEKKLKKNTYKSLYYKIGVAAFAFGNIMLLSFPEYLGIDRIADKDFGNFINFLMVVLSLPVFFYSGSDYFKSAFKGIKSKVFNIDIPLSLGILTLFARSLWEVISQSGPGYFDSFTGLVFFLLLGKLFQNKTYENFDFERTYKSYFPLSVTIIKNKIETATPVSTLKVGDRIIVRNKEIIPADSILFRGNANIDYSFVTGESIPVNKVLGEIIYAGGRQAGNIIELEVLKEVSQSYLTQLWNNSAFHKDKETNVSKLANSISKYFTFAILTIAIISGILWFHKDIRTAINVFTSVLIIACPCALALSIPFTFGNTLRIMGRLKFYLKNTSVVEKLSKINTVVFDKTGTLTKSGDIKAEFDGKELNIYDKILVKALTRNSNHILSRKIFESLEVKDLYDVDDYEEITGKGISGIVDGNKILLGSDIFINEKLEECKISVKSSFHSTKVFLCINNEIPGYFKISSSYRTGLEQMIEELNYNYSLHILSGDNMNEKSNLVKIFGSDKKILFRQSPEDKLNYIKRLQAKGKRVLMLGDGLNDAGALQQSDVGITISDNVFNFSPACDAILDADMFHKIGEFLDFSKFSYKVIIYSFIFSLIYNIIGLTFAVNGVLSPIISAILMPLSSVSVVLFAVT